MEKKGFPFKGVIITLSVILILEMAAIAAVKLVRSRQEPPEIPAAVVAEAPPAPAPEPEPEPEPTPMPEPEPAPGPEPAPAPEPMSEPEPEIDRAAALLAEMSLRDKVCQMLIVQPSALTGVPRVTEAGELTRRKLEEYPVGGLFYNAENMVSREQVLRMLTTVQGFSKVPLLLMCDEEGGRVARLMRTVGTTRVGAMLNYKNDGPETAFENARTIAADMVSCGLNLDFAPVADVWSNPNNTVIGDRAYSDDFDQAAELIPAAVRGFHEGGVACTLKHFPGHGDTATDSHYGAAYVTKTLDELRDQELKPFQAGIDAGADMVMMGHIIVEDVSPEPVLFSPALVTELLREEMGFTGVVVTDALQMQALTNFFTTSEVACKAVQAGVDILLCPGDTEGTIQALLDAVEDGELTETRIDESVLRILRMKESRGLL